MPNSPTLTPDDRSDAELASLVARRDPEGAVPAFQTLHGRYGGRLLAWLASRVDAGSLESAGRDVWSRIWAALGNPEEYDGQDFATLILQQAEAFVNGGGSKAPDFAGRVESLDKGLAGLHAGERVVVEFKLGGLTFEEIATRAKSTAERARKVYETAQKKLNASLEAAQP